jgi:hypothetical protein
MSLARKIRREQEKREEGPVKKKRPKAIIEPLEPRLLLDATLQTAGVAAAISSGLDQFENKLDSFVDTDALLDTCIPLIVRNEGTDLTSLKSIAPSLQELLSVDTDINRDGFVGANPNHDIPFDIVNAENALKAFDSDQNGNVDILELLGAKFFDRITTYLAGSPSDSGFPGFLNALDVTGGAPNRARCSGRFLEPGTLPEPDSYQRC